MTQRHDPSTLQQVCKLEAIDEACAGLSACTPATRADLCAVEVGCPVEETATLDAQRQSLLCVRHANFEARLKQTRRPPLVWTATGGNKVNRAAANIDEGLKGDVLWMELIRCRRFMRRGGNAHDLGGWRAGQVVIEAL